jgi:hypothetical protein
MGWFDKFIKKSCELSYVSIGFKTVADDCGPIFFYVCKKCNHRMCFMDSWTKTRTADWFKERVKLWENNQYELTENDVSSDLLSEDAIFLEKCLELNDK